MERNYQPNSHKYKEEKKEKVEMPTPKPLEGGVKVKKKSGLQKITNSLINEDIPKVKEYVISDVLLPSIKKAISDIVRNGIDMILYGDTGRGRGKQSSRVSYVDYYDKPVNRDRERERSSSRYAVYDYDNLVFDRREDALVVLSQLEDIVDRYGFARVSDLYDCAHKTIDNYQADNYGWTDLRNAGVVATRDGFVIKLPRALPID